MSSNIFTQESKSGNVYMAYNVNCRMADWHSRSFVYWKAFQITFVIKLCSGWRSSIDTQRSAVRLRQSMLTNMSFLHSEFFCHNLFNWLIFGINFLFLSVKLTSWNSPCLWLGWSFSYDISLCQLTHATWLRHIRRDAARCAGSSAKVGPCMHRK